VDKDMSEMAKVDQSYFAERIYIAPIYDLKTIDKEAYVKEEGDESFQFAVTEMGDATMYIKENGFDSYSELERQIYSTISNLPNTDKAQVAFKKIMSRENQEMLLKENGYSDEFIIMYMNKHDDMFSDRKNLLENHARD
jgi:hypothetical protein